MFLIRLCLTVSRNNFYSQCRERNTGEFKKLRRLLQRKRHIKKQLCVRLNVSRLFQVGHVVQNKRSALSFAWHEWFSCKGKE